MTALFKPLRARLPALRIATVHFLAQESGVAWLYTGLARVSIYPLHEVCKASAYETGELNGLSGGTPTYFFVTDPDGYRIEVKREK